MESAGNLHYLIYTSKTTIPFDEAVLGEILTVSRKWNDDHGITGVLLYHKGNVMQVLEGSDYEILDLFEQIKKDPRHRDIHKIAFRKIKARSFSNWAMAFKTADRNLFEKVKVQDRLLPLSRQISYTENAEDSILSVINMFIAINPLS